MNEFEFSDIDLLGHSSGNIRTLCPACSNQRRKAKEKCLAVDIDRKVWFCHHCSTSGGSKGEHYEKNYMKPITYKRPTPVKKKLGEKEYSFFKNRGISAKTVERAGIYSGLIWMPQVEKEVNAIHFPYLREGELINVKSRDGQKHFRLAKGAERIVFGLDDINEFTTVIVEGEMDKLACDEAGFINSISVPDGAPDERAKNYSSKFDFLEADEEKLNTVLKWIVATDQDAPGVNL